MFESRTVAVALDVHKASIRLSAVCADELLEEQSLPYDHAVTWRFVVERREFVEQAAETLYAPANVC